MSAHRLPFRALGPLSWALLLTACGSSDGTGAPAADGSILGDSLSSPLVLVLAAEKKLAKLLPTEEVDHYEASGIVAAEGVLYVVSDNTSQVAAIDTSLREGTLGPGTATESQYEAITATDDGRFFAVSESVDEADTRGVVTELGPDTAAVGTAFTQMTFPHANKGFEGLAWLRKDGADRLLALCENNDCENDGSTPGEGRVKVLAFDGAIWVTETTLKLPENVQFLKYSDLALRALGDGSYTVAIVSRKSSALWVGRLTTSPWALTGPSQFYVFPRAGNEIIYCSVEGVTFLGPSVLAMVSDKSNDGSACSAKEQSIHVFQLQP